MRIARIKVPTSDRDSVYHVMTRTVNGAFLLDDKSKIRDRLNMIEM